MQSPLLSLRSILDALDLDAACIPLLEQAHSHPELMHANTPERVYAVIRTVGDILNASQKAHQLAESLEERIDIITHKLKFITSENKPAVLFLNDVSPVNTVYNEYLGNMVRIAGGKNLPDTPHDERNPDTIIVVSDKPVAQVLNEISTSLSTPEWSQTNAVRNGDVFIIRSVEYLRQPGAALADDVEILAEILQPKYFVFGRDEDAWMKFEWQ